MVRSGESALGWRGQTMVSPNVRQDIFRNILGGAMFGIGWHQFAVLRTSC